MSFGILSVLLLLLVFCLFVTIFFRLHYHPLAKFPGPSLAAATHWYEFYYDVICSGQFAFKIQELHARYGPIVRINPTELHILDSGFYNTLYTPTGASKRDKYAPFYAFCGLNLSSFGTGPHELHRLRRRPLAAAFTRKAVKDAEPLIMERVNAASARLDEAAAGLEIVVVDEIISSLSMDLINRYCFDDEDSDHVADKTWAPRWKEMIHLTLQNGPLFRAFPWIPHILRRLPRSILSMVPSLRMYCDWRDQITIIVDRLYRANPKTEYGGVKSVFASLVHDEGLPATERSEARLSDEAFFFTAAGIDTIESVFKAFFFYLLGSPDCHLELKEELRLIWPDPHSDPPTTDQLRDLPFLSACIQESLRMGNASSSRLPRVAREPIVYKDWVIPPGTPVSQSQVDVLNDPVIFHMPDKFMPQRWLGEHGKKLAPFQVAFGKGNRSCLGYHFAYAELYLVCATFIRRFDLDLFQTNERDIKMARDYFVPAAATYRGVRITVKKASEEFGRRDSILSSTRHASLA